MNDKSAPPGVAEPLQNWLTWLESVHPVSIDMGLERVALVADRLQLRPISTPLILVAGTNGKGSTVAMLSSIYSEAGYRVGAYTSPHIIHFCERICVNGKPVSEDEVVQALAFVEQGRSPQTLTYFEYTTLAAMHVFSMRQCDVILLEVGLGGRMDATNIWDANCAIVTSIALDHQEYLGSDINVIATEKAAIGRRGKPLILGERTPPASLLAFAEDEGFVVRHVGALPDENLPETALPGSHQRRNAACAMSAVESLSSLLPVSRETIDIALKQSFLSARFEQTIVDDVSVVMDVAHNPASAAALRDAWLSQYPATSCDMIFAVMGDKDIAGIVRELCPIVSHWHFIELPVARAASLAQLTEALECCQVATSVKVYEDAALAWASASQMALAQNRPVLIAGSFHTIAAMQSVFNLVSS